MLGWLEAAKEKGVIKHVEDIKLSNGGKKIFREGVVFDTFVEENDVFAVANFSKEDIKKIAERETVREHLYLYPPLKHNCRSLVRISAYVLLVSRKWLKS